jgi:murein DD-endopeptidase MepM/ murein hydrolase activator NlpD
VGESTEDSGGHGWHGSVSALDIRLTVDHGGLPAGSEILIGYAAANVRADAIETQPATTETQPSTVPTGKAPGATAKGAGKNGKKSKKAKKDRLLPIGKIPSVQPHLTAGRYVFPVYGDAAYGDTFGAARADVNWHHGDDIFAPLGAPVLAVADGTVFSVGWNAIGGWRLWLRDRAGNEFYYAHLSAYSPYALNRAQVRAGTVLGFVGSTGDAEGTPYHLHFEVHPVGLLGLGYDGAVNPTPYLDAWRRLQDIRFGTGGAWLPGLVRLTPSRAPEPGAILLQITDISSANGLEPGSLRRALAPLAPGGDAALAGGVGLPTSALSGDLGRG